MRRELIRTSAFVRAAKRLLRKNPGLESDLRETLKLLSQDAHLPQLRTHKLTGTLRGSWASSAGYDLRVIFSFVKTKNKESILLETVGTHDEVY